MVHAVESGRTSSARTASEAISSTMPSRTICRAVSRRDSECTDPLATNEPTARGSSASPACSASIPSAYWNHSGSDRMSPNSPSETVSAVTLPLLKVGIRNSDRSSSTDRPASPRDRSHSTKHRSTSAAATNTSGMTLRPPRLSGAESVAVHHP